MACSIADCIKNTMITSAEELYTQLHLLESRNDGRRTSSEVPELHTNKQVTKFCNTYDEMVGHYQAPCVISIEEELTKVQHTAVNWMNRMLRTEPANNREG